MKKVKSLKINNSYRLLIFILFSILIFGKAVNKPIDDFNHLMDAMRYALEDYMRNNRMTTLNKNILGVR